jgi:2-polyprenyl-3-methyl-5-hydroxy-6-metoxy-1,4-benzoquinol methylase
MNSNCPVCGNSSEELYKAGRNKILSSLNSFFGAAFSPSIIKTDYIIRKCNSCTLEFADPLLPGDNEFYEALASHEGYYPHVREEYGIVSAEIAKTKGTNAKILDIGCGSGDFLEMLRNEKFTNACGIDATAASVEACKAKGLDAYRCRIEDFEKGPFDAIVSFHCLEHVDNPVEFIRLALEKLSPGGTLYISTPYSPQTHEYGWFHPLNHPPHHLLRLNEISYRALAEKTGSNIRFMNFNSVSPRSLFRTSFSFAAYGKNLPGSSAKMGLRMLGKPLLALRIWKKMKSREIIDGKIAGNEILVLFQKN